MFSQASVRSHLQGGGGTPILPDGGDPLPRSGWGVYPHLRSGWGGTPSKIRTGVPPHPDLGWGTHPYPDLGRGYSHPDLGMGYPPPDLGRWYPPCPDLLKGYPPVQVWSQVGGIPNRNLLHGRRYASCVHAGGLFFVSHLVTHCKQDPVCRD